MAAPMHMELCHASQQSHEEPPRVEVLHRDQVLQAAGRAAGLRHEHEAINPFSPHIVHVSGKRDCGGEESRVAG
jgi:hypothetical protein